MGWLFYHKQHGTTLLEEFSTAFNYDRPEQQRSGKVLACSTINRVSYMAYEIIHGNERSIVALVCLVDYRPKEYHNFGYKDMDETMGPYSYDCPAHILDMLTPTDHESALRWRKMCREVQEKKARLKTLKPGTKLRFPEPIRFTDGYSASEFTLRSIRCSSAIVQAPDSTLYRITRIHNKQFEIVQ